MEQGKYYIAVHCGWNDTEMNFPIYEEKLGEFIRNCPEIPDWNNSVLDFKNKDGRIYKFRVRPTNKFKEFYPYKFLMERAYNRINAIHKDISLKEELIQKACKRNLI